ncbi:WcbI family polysaccharide biosynthesis putative acetyltransferase [Brevundimonas intermedia]|uniref:WcbI family polysaccharide biosynthesis putative acetyltransferase n=1 Tax=Brevundimonas intermedia TaxID=74315 RepID=UPI00320A1F28
MSLKIYIHGNCQATAIAELFREALSDKASVVAREVFSVDVDVGSNEIAQLLRWADVVISQPVVEGYRGVDFLSTSWLSSQIKVSAVFLKVPVIYDRTQLPQCFNLRELHEGRLAYHDAHALDYFLNGFSVEDFLRDTRRSDFLSEKFVQSEALLSLREILRREREAEVDIRVSDSLTAALDVRQPMLSVNHPDRGLLAELTNRLLVRMGRVEAVAVAGTPMLDHFVVPPYLSTALGLGHDGAGMDFDRVRHDARWESRDDYFTEVFSIYAHLGREKVGSICAGQHDLGAYLQRFKEDSSGGGRDPKETIDAMYRGFFGRTPESKEALYHLQVLKQAGFEALLGQFLAFSKANGG